MFTSTSCLLNQSFKKHWFGWEVCLGEIIEEGIGVINGIFFIFPFMSLNCTGQPQTPNCESLFLDSELLRLILPLQ